MIGFRFASPAWLLLLLLLPLAARWLRSRRGDAPMPALRHADASLLIDLPVGWRTRAAGWLPRLRWLAIGLLLLALARPQAGHARQVVSGEGIDVVLALDVSGSMAALDFQPQNRLEAARAVIGRFIAGRPYDRIGLVIFAREAFGHSPLTVDHAVLERQLTQVALAADLDLDDGTAIGLGLANAANMLRASQAPSRVIVLLTDGSNNAGRVDPLTAAEAAAALGIKVYTIGIGKPGQVPVPVPGPFGPRVMYQESDLDEDTLKAIAAATDGIYFRATDSQGLDEIYRRIDALETSKLELSSYSRYRELAGWLLAPALLLAALELWLRHGPLRSLP